MPASLTTVSDFWPKMLSGITGGDTAKVVKISGINVHRIDIGTKVEMLMLLNGEVICLIVVGAKQAEPMTKAIIAANK
jgi:hypothetical protein